MAPTPVNVFGTNDKYARYRTWKEQTAPLVYDWLSSRTFSWPHGAVQWGALTHNGLNAMNSYNMYQSSLSHNQNNFVASLHLPSGQSDAKSGLSDSQQQQGVQSENQQLQQQQQIVAQTAWSMRSLFLAERTDQVASPNDSNTLLQYDVRVIHELVNKPNEITKPWIEEPHASNRDNGNNREFTLRKRVIHPGEVNRIRLVTPNLVLTHTDSPNLFLWDMERQPDRKKHDTTPNKPTCQLTGHKKNAEFALDVYGSGANNNNVNNVRILSGGHDFKVCLWHLGDYEALQGDLLARAKFSGHTDVIDDVSFQRSNTEHSNVFVSVGRDSAMVIWDCRTSSRPSDKVSNAHAGDINCCDFGGMDGNCIITGGSDKFIRVWDLRYLRDSNNQPRALNLLYGHRHEVTNLSWNRFERNVFASGAEDGEVLIWRLAANGSVAASNGNGNPHNINTSSNNIANSNHISSNNIKSNNSAQPVFDQNEGAHSPELMFRHVGHSQSASTITDLDWLPSATDKWCLASISEPSSAAGGSTLQIWRMSDLIYRNKEEVMEELRQHNERMP